MEALGLIELYGYVPAVVALDAALKAANVSLQGMNKIDGGMVSIMVTGDVAAVKAAMEAADAAAGRIGKVFSVHVIPRPHGEVDHMLTPSGGPGAAAPQQGSPSSIETVSDEETILEDNAGETDAVSEEAFADAQTEQEVLSQDAVLADLDKDALASEETQDKLSEDREALMASLTPDKLEAMTVKELRVIARTLDLDNMTKKEIRFGKKEELISSICKYLEKGY